MMMGRTRSVGNSWLLLLAIVLLPGMLAYGAERRIKPRVQPPVPAESQKSTPRPAGRQAPTPRPIATVTPNPLTRSIAVNVEATTGTPMPFVPEHYRTMPRLELEEEMDRLREVVKATAEGSAGRRNAEELLEILQMRLDTGILPEDFIAEITSKVCTLRMLPLKEPIRFRILDERELRGFLEKKFDSELPEWYLPNYEFLLKTLGAIPSRTNLRESILSLLSEQVAGLYDEDTKILYVMKHFGFDRALARIILSHEICHALQDQNFNIAKLPISDPNNDDLSMAVASTLEGDATILMQEFAREAIAASDILQLLDVFKIDQKAFNKTPYFLRQHLLFPYMSGANFMLSVMVTNATARDRAFTKYPVSTEQIMHPEKYISLDFDQPTSFTLPDFSPALGPGWRATMQNTFGEFQIRTFFENWREWSEGREAANGWDGDRYTIYRNGDEYLLLWVTTWDTDNDANEFFLKLSDVMRTKRHRDLFAEQPFGGDVFIRTLEYEKEGKPDPATDVFLRFRKLRNITIAQISNSRSASEIMARYDDLLTQAVEGRAVVIPREEDAITSGATSRAIAHETTATITGTSETQTSASAPVVRQKMRTTGSSEQAGTTEGLSPIEETYIEQP